MFNKKEKEQKQFKLWMEKDSHLSCGDSFAGHSSKPGMSIGRSSLFLHLALLS
jgi:hypothetical protein